jgi:hypothetical protein
MAAAECTVSIEVRTPVGLPQLNQGAAVALLRLLQTSVSHPQLLSNTTEKLD